MQKKHLKQISLFLICILVMLLLCTASFADEAVPDMPYFDLPCDLDIVKVGLCVGGASVSSATLHCTDGSGFELGFFDFSRTFHYLGGSLTDYVTLCGDIGLVSGPWHILLNKAYSSYDDAAKAANEYGEGFPAYIDYKYLVAVGAYTSSDEAQSVIDSMGFQGTPFTGSADSVLAVKADSGRLLFMYDCSGQHLALRPVSGDQGETSFDGNTYHGSFRLMRRGDCLSVTNYVGLEDYVKGVLPYEVSASWPAEALKAQAVCARTYAINNINGYIEHDIDVRNDTYSQVYKGTSYCDGVIDAAADETADRFVRYNGAVCRVYYMSSDGGGTEEGVNVFGERRAYLSAIADTFEVASDFYGKTWSETYSPEGLSYALCRHGFDIGNVTDIKTTYSEIGNVIRLDFTDADGKTAYIERLDCYSVLGLNSIRYDVFRNENDQGDITFIFEGCGWGHNCGMSQWGACSMAQNANVSCGDIISYYFSGAYIA